jgi:hypothetical protein
MMGGKNSARSASPSVFPYAFFRLKSFSQFAPAFSSIRSAKTKDYQQKLIAFFGGEDATRVV